MQRINYNNLAENPNVIETTEKRLPKDQVTFATRRRVS